MIDPIKIPWFHHPGPSWSVVYLVRGGSRPNLTEGSLSATMGCFVQGYLIDLGYLRWVVVVLTVWPDAKLHLGLLIKEFVELGTIRMHYFVDVVAECELEQQARRNEICRCCVHTWHDRCDSLLKVAWREEIAIEENRSGRFLNSTGWRAIQKNFFANYHHLASVHFLQQRYHELTCKGKLTTSDYVVRQASDVDNIILYHP
ncbi:hypothetical protein MA16_Dca014698 [Dendrobium catenatum]|uniref:Uncharacterized protein n=1 Tax=Dendrobium catenatum TaxID=906689 RepID=A0A2I0VIJ1_9ASPA|nr:hypothetical protein MA16_Dca014698 [Dendrobium catenatum]